MDRRAQPPRVTNDGPKRKSLNSKEPAVARLSSIAKARATLRMKSLGRTVRSPPRANRKPCSASHRSRRGTLRGADRRRLRRCIETRSDSGPRSPFLRMGAVDLASPFPPAAASTRRRFRLRSILDLRFADGKSGIEPPYRIGASRAGSTVIPRSEACHARESLRKRREAHPACHDLARSVLAIAVPDERVPVVARRRILTEPVSWREGRGSVTGGVEDWLQASGRRWGQEQRSGTGLRRSTGIAPGRRLPSPAPRCQR